MTHLRRIDIWKYIATSLVCFAIIAPLLSKDIGKIAAGLILTGGLLTYLFSLLGLISFEKNSRPEKLFVLGSLAIFGNILISFLLFGDIFNSDGKTDLYVYLLVPLFLYPIIRSSQIDKNTVISCLCIAAIITGTVGIYEYWLTEGRVGYMFHGQPIPFGNLALCTGFACLAFLNLDNSKVANSLLIISASFGIIASILSQTRGGLIAIPLFMLILITFNHKYFLRKTLIAPMITGLLIIASTLFFSGVVEKVNSRLSASIENTSSFYDNSNKKTSSGVRLSLWSIAVDGWKESPLMGKGVTQFYDYKMEHITKGSQPEYLQRFKHAHNEYVEILFTRGLIGISLFTLLISSLIWFYLKQAKNSDTALTGLIITSGYLVFSLTESFFSLHTSLLYFLTINAVLIYLLSNNSRACKAKYNAT